MEGVQYQGKTVLWKKVGIPLLSHKTYFIEIKSILFVSEYKNVVWRFGAVFWVMFLDNKKRYIKKISINLLARSPFEMQI